MARREKLTRYVPGSFQGPRVHGPHVEGGKFRLFQLEGPHFKFPRRELTPHGKKVKASVIAAGVAGLVLYAEVAGGGGNSSSVKPDNTPGTSTSASGTPVPDTFRPGGTHKLIHVNGELEGSNGISFIRVYEGGHATNTWQAAFEPNWPLFPDGKWVTDPLQAGAACKLEGAGIIMKNPRMICDFTGNKGPRQTSFKHHGTVKK